MIGSFWNLCRACPSMPVDKLHSEYRSTYRWHEYTGPRQEVVRRAPQGGTGTVAPPPDEKRLELSNHTRIDEESHELPKLEPAMPRRKKYPELAYRHHEFILSDGNQFADSSDGHGERARSEERGVSHWRPSRRSKSEGPARSTTLMNGDRRRDSDPDIPDMADNTGRDSGLLKKAISKISTEYRLQFAWPQGHTSRRDASDVSAPRKSQSMGALKPAANAMIHRKRTEFEPRDGTASELEPLVNDNNVIKEEDSVHKSYTEYKNEFRPFTQYGNKKQDEIHHDSNKRVMQNGSANNEWLKEVAELRKKAGEYKNRGWGSKFAPEFDIYNKQVELWDQVSRRSSLSALSLASTAHRSYTKDEKDEDNTKKSSPTKALRNVENSTRFMKDMIRHHLVRTTGGSEFDGLILSPTREKLEPTIPKRDDDSRGSQKNSPKKNSPQKSAFQKKNSMKSKNSIRTARSQSVGPTDMTSSEKRSPKRQSRSATVKEKKTSTPPTNTTTNNVPVTKKPRPSSLNTTVSSRLKSSSVSSKNEEERLAKSKPKFNNESNVQNSKDTKKLHSASEAKSEKIVTEIIDPDPIDLEPVVKSPPEPTRVKSPEQIIMRSPDPVNWTVPLDTGKTFTVTQNVREGDIGTRPHSEQKAWTPPEVPPPVAQSAPPQLTEQCKDQARGLLPTSSSSNIDTGNSVTSEEVETSDFEDEYVAQMISSHEPKLCRKLLDVPAMSSKMASVSQKQQSLTSGGDLLQKARNRFDNFWKKNSNEEPV